MKVIIVFGLVACTAIPYLRILSSDFINLDDPAFVSANPYVVGGLTAENFVWAWTNFSSDFFYHPLTWLSYQLDAQLFGAGPWGFHLTNLLLHILNVLLVFFIFDATTKATLRSVVVATLFAVHPMHVESVAWVSERRDVLFTLFWLLLIAAHAWYAQRTTMARYALVLLAFVAGLLSKPMMVTAPCVLLLFDVWPLRRLATRPAGDVNNRQGPLWVLLEKVPLFMLALFVAQDTVQVLKQQGALQDFDVLPLFARLVTCITAYLWYLKMTVLPFGLCIWYPHPFLGNDLQWQVRTVVACGLVLLILSFVFAWSGRRCPALIVGWLWFLGTLFPVTGFLQSGDYPWADRYAYFPHIGLFLAIVWGMAEAFHWLRAPTWLPVAVSAVAVATLAVVTFVQVGVWEDSERLWLHAAAVTSNNARAYAALGGLYVEGGQTERAIELYTRAEAIAKIPFYEFCLARLYREQGQTAKAEFHMSEGQRLRTPDPDAPAHSQLAGKPSNALAWVIILGFSALMIAPLIWSLCGACAGTNES